jgi:hypothetical protein
VQGKSFADYERLVKKEEPNVRVRTTATYNSHRDLLGTAEYFLQTAQSDGLGKYHNFLAAILFSAFSIEAIGNAFGERLVEDWRDFERITPIAKLRLVAKTCGIKPDFGRAPWQTAQSLIDFRNKVAHARNKHFEQETVCALKDFKSGIDTRDEDAWQLEVGENLARTGCKEVRRIIEMLEKTLNQEDRDALTASGHQMHAKVTA